MGNVFRRGSVVAKVFGGKRYRRVSVREWVGVWGVIRWVGGRLGWC